MSSFEEHVQECIDKLGSGEEAEAVYREVNGRIDQFAHYPDYEFLKDHRKFLHHEEGIEYFKKRYGRLGGEAARLHVFRDCGGVPRMRDYADGTVDEFGEKISKCTHGRRRDACPYC